MHTEVEAKFVGIDPAAIRQSLKQARAKLISPERLMRRMNFDVPGPAGAQPDRWVRVRDEGQAVTLTYKQTLDNTVNGTREINVVVDHFDHAVELLTAIGLSGRSFQETRRESWLLGEVQVELDWWPWLPPLVELEGPNEAALQAAAQTLGLTWADHRAGDVTPVYQQWYKATTEDIYHERITFTDPCPWEKR